MATMRDEDWPALLARLLDGDRTAFATFSRLVTATLAGMRAYDFRDEWDDLVQEVIWIVVDKARSRGLRKPDAIAAFVRSTTKFHFIAWLRRKRPDALDDPDARPGAPCWPGEVERDPRVDEIWEEVRRLPEKQRLVLEAVYHEGHTVEGAASATGIPLGNAKRYLSQGLKTVRKRMAADEP